MHRCSKSSEGRYIPQADQEVLIIPIAYCLIMKTILILLSLLVAVSLAAAYSAEQQNIIDGTKLSFKLGQAYEKASAGGDVAAFNALVDQWNAWVVSTFGNDATLIMEKMKGPIDLQKPYYSPGNNTTNSLREHKMDSRSEYTTNDVNLMSDAAIAKYANSPQGKTEGADFLGGV